MTQINSDSGARNEKDEPQIAQISAERDERTGAIIGAAMDVHRTLGAGFLEAVYQEALAIEFKVRQIPFKRELGIIISYKGRPLRCEYRADFLCFGAIIIEIKAQSELTKIDQSQVLNYLRATDFEIGLLLNFGKASLEFRRVVLSKNLRKSAQSVVTLSSHECDAASEIE